MIRGPFGAPRPKSRHILVFDPDRRTIRILNVGPMGFPRPFSKINPEVEPERISECVMSESAARFGAGSVTVGATTDISELSPEAQLEALDRAEKWCEGILDATSRPDMTEEEAQQMFNEVTAEIKRRAGRQVPVESEVASELEDE